MINSRKILLTGGAGYIGSHIAKMLYESGYEPVIYDNLSTGHRKFVKWGEYFYFGNCGDKNLFKKALLETNPECIIHLAGSAYVGESINDPSKYYNNNIVETISMLDAMHETGYKKNHIFF